ncbi:response regulator transcription factor [bacterium]|nr:response regulator transcription factor [bacterium]
MGNRNRILLVEDEETLAVGLEYNLKKEGYAVTRVSDGKKALESFRTKSFDLILLDIMIPFVDGFEVARRIREESPQMPILVLSARSRAKDRIKGLEIGVDDYLVKPFHLKELLLRVAGMLKRKKWYRSSVEKSPVYRFGANTINFGDLTARSGKGVLRLTFHEAMVLKYLMDRRGKVVSRRELLENIWQIHAEVETRTVDAFIVRLRKYFEPNPEKPVFIKSIRSAGYLFTDA